MVTSETNARATFCNSNDLHCIWRELAQFSVANHAYAYFRREI